MLQEIGLDLPFSMKINQLLDLMITYYLRRVGRKAMKIKFNDVTTPINRVHHMSIKR